MICGNKMDNQKSIKKQKYDQKNWKTIKKTINIMKIITKMLQKRKIYKTSKFTPYKKYFFQFLKLDFGPSTII